MAPRNPSQPDQQARAKNAAQTKAPPSVEGSPSRRPLPSPSNNLDEVTVPMGRSFREMGAKAARRMAADFDREWSTGHGRRLATDFETDGVVSALVAHAVDDDQIETARNRIMSDGLEVTITKKVVRLK